VAQIRAQMQQVMQDVHFQGDLPAFLHFLRTDPQFYVKTPQALLDRGAWIAKEFDGKAAEWFGHLPRRRFAIVPVPDAIAPYYTAGRGGPGVYLINTFNLPSRPLYSLPALTLHESAPGHAFQMPLAAENKDLPAFRQESYISAYGEGWALYCEKLGEDMGLYHTPYERFGMLSYQAWRAARLVVDTGIHTMGWSRAQAQQYLRDNTALSDHEIETETDRYIAWPGQALSYYLGEKAILDARARAERPWAPSSTSARSTIPCCNWARCRCRCWMRRSIASSRRAAPAPIPTRNEETFVKGRSWCAAIADIAPGHIWSARPGAHEVPP
jgi:uncharacterized protein (DUF885 family)